MSQWDDLSDAELVARLTHKGVPLIAALALRDQREEPDAQDQIDRLLR